LYRCKARHAPRKYWCEEAWSVWQHIAKRSPRIPEYPQKAEARQDSGFVKFRLYCSRTCPAVRSPWGINNKKCWHFSLFRTERACPETPKWRLWLRTSIAFTDHWRRKIKHIQYAHLRSSAIVFTVLRRQPWRAKVSMKKPTVTPSESSWDGVHPIYHVSYFPSHRKVPRLTLTIRPPGGPPITQRKNPTHTSPTRMYLIPPEKGWALRASRTQTCKISMFTLGRSLTPLEMAPKARYPSKHSSVSICCLNINCWNRFDPWTNHEQLQPRRIPQRRTLELWLMWRTLQDMWYNTYRLQPKKVYIVKTYACS